MIRTTALTLSALANIALLALWPGGERTESAASATPPRTEPVHGQLATEGDFARWLALGLPDHEAKRLLFATLEASALGAIDSPWERYWRSGDPAAAFALAVTEAYGRVRLELAQAFGAAAATTPEFKRAFRPLDNQFGFLSGTEQVELQRRRLHAAEFQPRHATVLASPRAAELPRAGATSSVPLDFLAPAAAFEVELRDSPRAEQLRRSGIELDEHEFREVYALLTRADAEFDLAAQVSTRQQLRTLLGAERFAAVTAMRDPLFAVVERAGGEHGLDVGAIAAAYEVLSDAQGQLLDLAAEQPSGERAASRAAAIANAERERLDAAVGETAAAAIRAAREEFFVGASRAAAAAPNAPAR